MFNQDKTNHQQPHEQCFNVCRTGKVLVELGLKKPDNKVIFYVKDTGSVMPKKELSTIFDRSRKTDFQEQILHKGTGLGLAISKVLATLLDGHLTSETEIGKESTFSILLSKTIISQEQPTIAKTIANQHTKCYRNECFSC